MTLPADKARCNGVYDEEYGEWREGCETCLRRTDRPEAVAFLPFMEPPPIVALWCEGLIEPDFAPRIDAGSKPQHDEMTTKTSSENAGGGCMTPAILRRKPDHLLHAQRRFNVIDAANGNHPVARREQCQRIIKMIDAELERRARLKERACSA